MQNENEQIKAPYNIPQTPLDDLDDTDAESKAKAANYDNIILQSIPKSELEIAQADKLRRQDSQIKRIRAEVKKLTNFISKRKQTYKRKRKDGEAPTRALSAYNIFVRERFSKLAEENDNALKSSDENAQLKRIPPADLVASTGNKWKDLSASERRIYEEKALADKKRYEAQMVNYQPPEKQQNRKRNKTGYNMFFSAYVLRLKQSSAGVPSERGSVARLVGSAWKDLSPDEKQYYEKEAETANEGMMKAADVKTNGEDSTAPTSVPATVEGSMPLPQPTNHLLGRPSPMDAPGMIQQHGHHFQHVPSGYHNQVHPHTQIPYHDPTMQSHYGANFHHSQPHHVQGARSQTHLFAPAIPHQVPHHASAAHVQSHHVPSLNHHQGHANGQHHALHNNYTGHGAPPS
eukprot:CAMPEP_0194370288 /NCGR_PEP_ID=MMETSP0174-20130528/18559_1 /TAXON_ID=216777 /ORGANISM="Proboscia alata, Strain PI-D3" /LENGTH=403 /DNA_ID=CAMNT_0039147633 /DNA_START=175 /DNA_END=1386 /DNA_ORIENTATION=+